jgi:hypothetical protein
MLSFASDDVMILSSDEAEILDYLNTCRDGYVSIVEICRCAGGRQKFKDSPNWARVFMTRLVEARLVEVNDRGHFRRTPGEPDTELITRNQAEPANQVERSEPVPLDNGLIIGDNYFPSGPAEPDPMIDPSAPAPWVPRTSNR